MKRIFCTLLILSIFIIASEEIIAQCTPLTADECPDPENNGQVCPDSLAPAFLNQFYSQVATIKPPAQYYLPPDSTLINLHHVKLKQVGNLPDGITWQSNTPDSVFNAGEYYCILMEGTPDSAGLYHLKIVVDVYVMVFNFPVLVTTATDSTSLTLEVIDNSGILTHDNTVLFAEQNVPNPFRDETRVRFYHDKTEEVTFEVFSLIGKTLYSEKILAAKGENVFVFKGNELPNGTYLYRVRSDRYQSGGMMIRAD